MGVLFTLVVSGLAALVLGLAIKYTIGWRVTEEDEVDGIDFAQHGETAYDLHTTTGGRSVGGSSLAAGAVKEGASA
jgi:Amt family ammonium transporter